MSEKQFYTTDIGLGLDTISDEMYSFSDEEDFCKLFDKLNEQQDKISELKEENEQLRKQVESSETTSNATSDYNAFLESKITTLEKENRELNSIKKFAEKNGINIFLIEEAFRKCWKDNGKLFEENEKLQKENNDYEKRFIYILKNYPFYEGGTTLFVSDNLERALAEYEKIEKKQGYGYIIKKYPLNVFCDNYWLGETVKHQEFCEDGVYEWTGDDINNNLLYTL